MFFSTGSALELQAIVECLADDGTDDAVRHGRDVKDDGLEFVVVDFAIRQNGFIGLLGEYILSINQRVMRRPLVVEEERLNFPEDAMIGGMADASK